MAQTNNKISKGEKTIQLLKRNFLLLLTEKKPESITIEDICRLSNITKGSFYHHFESKDDFIAQVFRAEVTQHMIATIEQADLDHPHSPRCQIRAWIDGITCFAMKHDEKITAPLNHHASKNLWNLQSQDWIKKLDLKFAFWQNNNLIRTDVSVRELHDYCDTFTYGIYVLGSARYTSLPLHTTLVEGYVNTFFATPSHSE